jgi:hypothetical protein
MAGAGVGEVRLLRRRLAVNRLLDTAIIQQLHGSL